MKKYLLLLLAVFGLTFSNAQSFSNQQIHGDWMSMTISAGGMRAPLAGTFNESWTGMLAVSRMAGREYIMVYNAGSSRASTEIYVDGRFIEKLYYKSKDGNDQEFGWDFRHYIISPKLKRALKQGSRVKVKHSTGKTFYFSLRGTTSAFNTIGLY